MSDYVQGDIGVNYSATCRRGDESLIDLTNKIVTLCFRINDGAVKRRQMEIEDPPTAGNVIYTFQAGDLDESGVLMLEIEITGAAVGGVEIVAGVNDKQVFSLGLGNLEADIAPAEYTDEVDLCDAVVAAMVAAWFGVAFTCIWDPGTGLVTIGADVPLSLKNLTGGSTIHSILGFPDVDTGAALSHTGTTPMVFSNLTLTSKDPQQYIVRPRV